MDKKELKNLCEEYLNNWKRASADYQNLQKDLGLQRQQMRTQSVTHTAHVLLPMIDNFAAAFDHVPETEDKQVKAWLQGMEHIRKQADAVLTDLGLVEIEAEGFADPMLHEIVGSEEAKGDDDTIIRVTQKGYQYGETVIRPTKVIVIKN